MFYEDFMRFCALRQGTVSRDVSTHFGERCYLYTIRSMIHAPLQHNLPTKRIREREAEVVITVFLLLYILIFSE
jgi:hypothetical protein